MLSHHISLRDDIVHCRVNILIDACHDASFRDGRDMHIVLQGIEKNASKCCLESRYRRGLGGRIEGLSEHARAKSKKKNIATAEKYLNKKLGYQ